LIEGDLGGCGRVQANARSFTLKFNLCFIASSVTRQLMRRSSKLSIDR